MSNLERHGRGGAVIATLLLAACAGGGVANPEPSPGSVEMAATSVQNPTTIVNTTGNPVITRSLSPATDSVGVSGTVTVANSSLPVTVGNFPATQQVAGTVAISNLPATQDVSGTVSVGNFPATQTVSGAVSVSNFPASQTVSGTVNVGNLPAVQPVTGTVNVGNTPTMRVDSSTPVATTDRAALANSNVIMAEYCTWLSGELACYANGATPTPAGMIGFVIEEISCYTNETSASIVDLSVYVDGGASTKEAFVATFQTAGDIAVMNRQVRLYSSKDGVQLLLRRTDAQRQAQAACVFSGHYV